MKAWVALNAAPGIGPHRFHSILNAFGSPEKALGASAAQLGSALGSLGAKGAAELLAFASRFDGDRELELAAAVGARILVLDDPGYPALLKAIHEPPPLLYLWGTLPEASLRCLAVVGSRKPTEYGLRQCRSLVGGLAASGAAIVSGLARGIDTAAHTAALEFKLQTLGVLGSGLGRIYPPENAALARRMAESGGGVLSQFSMECQADRGHFPMRNGVISGLSAGVVVVEGEEDSGSLITAEWALEQGREIFALPGSVESSLSRGPMRLIQQGAKLVMGAEDILSEFPGFLPQPKGPARPRGSAPGN
jgi:DNA processing protein